MAFLHRHLPAILPDSPLPFRNPRVKVAASETNNAKGLLTKRGAALALLLQNSAALLPGWMNSCGNSPEQAENDGDIGRWDGAGEGRQHLVEQLDRDEF